MFFFPKVHLSLLVLPLFFLKVLYFSGFWIFGFLPQEFSEGYACAFPKQLPVEQGIAAGDASLLLSATEEERVEGPQEQFQCVLGSDPSYRVGQSTWE